MRPVFIVGQGPSLQILKDNIFELQSRYPDCLWAGMNDYKVAEAILSKVNKSLDFMFFSDPHLISIYAEPVLEFLNRPVLNHFIGDYDTIKQMEIHTGFRIENANGSVIYSSQSRGRNLDVSDKFYNSLTALLLTLIGLGYREFMLFGFDGGGDHNKALYYGVDACQPKDNVPASELSRRLAEDTKMINDNFWDLKKLVTTEHVQIHNICPDSFITAFPKACAKDVCS